MTLAEALLIALTALLCIVVLLLIVLDFRMRQQVGFLTDEVRELRLKSRTRVSQAAVRDGPVSEEAQLARLGRSSAAKRVVVGGEDESPQKQRLIKQNRVGGDEEEEDE